MPIIMRGYIMPIVARRGNFVTHLLILMGTNPSKVNYNSIHTKSTPCDRRLHNEFFLGSSILACAFVSYIALRGVR